MLSLPDVTDLSNVEAAIEYAACGWYVGPTSPGTKNPGNVLGGLWQDKTSRSPDVIRKWYAGNGKNRGVFLHLGKSGAVAFDIDNPAATPNVLVNACVDDNANAAVPAVRTRRIQSVSGNGLVRGHYLFLMPEGRVIGNSVGGLGREWGQVRGCNGVIIAPPSKHEDAKNGGEYGIIRGGVVPNLPSNVNNQLKDYIGGVEKDLDWQTSLVWLRGLNGYKDDMCKRMQEQTDYWVNQMPYGSHDIMRDGSYNLVLEAMEGHSGIYWALGELGKAFEQEHAARRSSGMA